MIREGIVTKLKITILRINHDYPSCNVTKQQQYEQELKL